jgi:hypothetical protein
MGETFDRLSSFKGGNRILNANPGLSDALDVMDGVKCGDLGTVLMYQACVRADKMPLIDILNGTNINAPSTVSLRDFHYLEGIIMGSLADTEFVDLSPLQPLGTSSNLSGTDQKTIMPALRRSEVNSDATTSLFREANSRRKTASDGSNVHLATNSRITRLQAFDPKTGFLPHFRIFAQVTVGQGQDRGPEEIEAFVTHLSSEVAILDEIAASKRGDIKSLSIKIGNIVLAEDVIGRGLVDRSEVRRRTQDPEFDLLMTAGIDIPSVVPLEHDRISEVMEAGGFKKGKAVLDRFIEVVEYQAPELIPRLTLDLGRVAGIGYYRHLCYKIHATNSDGLALPLVDGGTTDWAKKIDPTDKNVLTVVSGIGTELLAKHFLTTD